MFELIVIFVLIVANGLFAGAEIAIVSVRQSRLVELAEQGRRDVRAVLALRKTPERFLATVQVGITVIGATAAAFGGRTIAGRLTDQLAKIQWLSEVADDLALAIVIAGISYLSIVLGELVPKSLGLRAAESYALFIGRFLLALSWLARPLVWLLTASSNLVLKPFGDQTTFSEARYTPAELQQLLDEAAKYGTVHPDAGEIASRALDFPELTASDVMVPRPQVVALARDASPESIRTTLLENTHTRLPVYEGSVDNVVGYISVKDLLAVAWEQRLIVLEDVLRPAYFVPETKGAVEVLQEMRRKRTPFAVVVDEQGGMSGIVTIEDLVEELVGEIFSEYATPVELCRMETEHTALVNALMPIRDVNRALGVALPDEGRYTTLGGLCVARANGIPGAGRRISFPGAVLEVVDASPRRVLAVRVHKTAAQEDDLA